MAWAIGTCPGMRNLSFLTKRLQWAGEPRPYPDNKEIRGIRDYSQPFYLCQGRGVVPAPTLCCHIVGQSPSPRLINRSMPL